MPVWRYRRGSAVCSSAYSWGSELSTLALEPSESTGLGRYLDLAVLVLALAVFLIADLPIVAWAAIAAAWLAQRAVQAWAVGRISAAEERTSALRVIAGTFMARLWLLTIAILVVGIAAGDEAGLSAAVLAAVLVTANFAGEALARPREARP